MSRQPNYEEHQEYHPAQHEGQDQYYQDQRYQDQYYDNQHNAQPHQYYEDSEAGGGYYNTGNRDTYQSGESTRQ